MKNDRISQERIDAYFAELNIISDGLAEEFPEFSTILSGTYGEIADGDVNYVSLPIMTGSVLDVAAGLGRLLYEFFATLEQADAPDEMYEAVCCIAADAVDAAGNDIDTVFKTGLGLQVIAELLGLPPLSDDDDDDDDDTVDPWTIVDDGKGPLS